MATYYSAQNDPDKLKKKSPIHQNPSEPGSFEKVHPGDGVDLFVFPIHSLSIGLCMKIQKHSKRVLNLIMTLISTYLKLPVTVIIFI